MEPPYPSAPGIVLVRLRPTRWYRAGCGYSIKSGRLKHRHGILSISTIYPLPSHALGQQAPGGSLASDGGLASGWRGSSRGNSVSKKPPDIQSGIRVSTRNKPGSGWQDAAHPTYGGCRVSACARPSYMGTARRACGIPFTHQVAGWPPIQRWRRTIWRASLQGCVGG